MNLQHSPLQFDVGLQQFDPLLVGADRDVVLGDVAEHGDHHGVVAVDRSVQVGRRPLPPRGGTGPRNRVPN